MAFSFIKVKVTQHKANNFKVNNSLALRTLTMLGNHHLHLVPSHFITPKENPAPIKLLLSKAPSPQTLATTYFISLVYGFAYSKHFIVTFFA